MATKTRTTSPGLIETILDLDYGDEQERTRYYEVQSVLVNVEAVLLPLVGALALVGFGREAIGPVVVMVAAFFVPLLLSNFYLTRYGVRTISIARSPKNRRYMIVYFAAWVIFLAALTFELAA